MYQNLINSLKKILDSKATQAEKLLKISTLVDFADGLDKRPSYPVATPPQPSTTVPIDLNNVQVKKPGGPGAIIGVEDVK